MASPHGFWNAPPAYMGFVGFVRLKNTGGVLGNSDGVDSVTHPDYLIRATTADINLTQEVTKPDVIDSRYDRSVYQLGPKLIDGSVAFPVVYELPPSATDTLFEILYRYAVTRQNSGRLSEFDMEVKYASSNTLPHNDAEFVYRSCIVNTWQFAVAQSDVVTCTFDIIGVNREPAGVLDPPARSDSLCSGSSTTSSDAIGTTRIVTWNDSRVELTGGRLVGDIGGQYIRTFEVNINNDAERFYTLNTKLFAQSIAPRKRDVTGSVVILGRHPDLGSVALTNEDNCTESGEVKFGYATEATGEGCTASSFGVTLPNCIFEIETMSLSNDIFETTVNFHSLPSAGTGTCDPLLSSLDDTTFNYESQA
jgi:hypothetical protein